LTATAIAEVPRTKAAAMLEMPSDANSASVNIPVARILRSPFNRKPELNEDFIANVRQYGVLQPIIVRQVRIGLDRLNDLPQSTDVKIGEAVYEIVAGERRWLASKKSNKPSISAIVRVLTDIQVMEIQIAENDHRDDYSVMDRAESYSNLRAKYMEAHKGEKGWTEGKCMDLIASRLNQEHIKGRTVQQIIALGKLEWQIQAALRNGELEQSHGYELCRRPEEEQLKLLAWIRKETQHSQDIPSVRRLKLEIRNVDTRAEDKRRQDKLFKEGPGASAKLTFDGKTIDLAPGPLPGSVRTALLKPYPDLSSTAHFLQDGRVQLARGLTGKPFYLTVDQLQGLLSTGVLRGLDPAQTSAPPASDKVHQSVALYKPPSKAQIKAVDERHRKAAQQEEKRELSVDLERQARLIALDAIAKKAKLDRSLIDLVAIEILKVSDDHVMLFAQRAWSWPKPKSRTYSWNETTKIAQAHVPKLKPAQLAGLLVAGLLSQDLFVYPGNVRECKTLDAMVRKYRINLDKIREEVKAKAKAGAGKKSAKA
jgi:ParB/RepB/Spo0J family partition protein